MGRPPPVLRLARSSLRRAAGSLGGRRTAAAALVATVAVTTPGSAAGIGRSPRASTAEAVPSRAAPAPIPPSLDAQLDGQVALGAAVRVGDALRAPLGDGREAVLTLDPALEDDVARTLADAGAEAAAAVVLSVDGRVLALAGAASRRDRDPDARDPRHLPLVAEAPAASVFKIVTALALAEHGVAPETVACYHGGQEGLELDNIEDQPRRDRSCATLAQALADSTNAVVAKLATHLLRARDLAEVARALGFGAHLPFAAPVEPSIADLPASGDGLLALGRAAAGFGDVRLSPLFGALMAETLANHGMQFPPRLVAGIIDGAGRFTPADEPPPHQVVPAAAADEVAGMLLGTTEYGTASRNFRGAHGLPLLPFPVAGKTGSLSRPEPYLHYHWFVGFAPADHPQIAFAVLVENQVAWRVRATMLAEHILAAWATEQGMALAPPSRFTFAAR